MSFEKLAPVLEDVETSIPVGLPNQCLLGIRAGKCNSIGTCKYVSVITILGAKLLTSI